MSKIRLKRVYDPAEPEDGTRVLVDRLWPRGLSRDAAKLDQWLKDVAPSTELRRWFGHDPAKWAEFRRRYEAELAHNPALEELRAIIRRDKRVTLLFGARDVVHNDAVVLREVCARN
jgi:uncharacterized protein YeaO (DUF488 family)